MVCLFCLNETDDGVSLHGASELAKHARNIIAKHFWFDVNDINSAERYACSRCWSEVELFHDFYEMVETNYRKRPNNINSKNSVNPLVDGELKTIDDESVVNSENDETAACAPENESVFVESLFVCDSSNEEFDSYENDESSISHERSTRNTHTCLAPNQESVPIYRSHGAKKQSTPGKKQPTLHMETKLTSDESTKRQYTKFTETFSTATEFECFICRKLFASLRGVQRHMHIHDPIQSFIYECELCGKSYSRKKILERHIKYHIYMSKKKNILKKSRMRTTCPICQKELNCGSLKTHILMVHEKKKPIREKKYICEWCGKGFSAPSALATHALTHIDRAITQIKCEICGKFSKNQKSHRRHMKIHERIPFKCPHCDKEACNAFELKSHISQFHSMHKHQCTICDKLFARPVRLKEHMATHSNESVYNCLYCAKTFKGNSSRYTHLRLHHPKEYDLYHDKRKPK